MTRISALLLLVALVVGRCSAAVQEPRILTPVENSISASPSRIILGALPYGEKDDSILTRQLTIQGLPEPVNLAGIDLSQAGGVQVIKQEKTPDGLVLTLNIDLRQFASKQPFGSFIKKIIRLETNSTDEPQVVVPILGWLAVNDSSRNFNQFVFDGCERWQGWWGTPNMAGAVLAPLIVLLIGGMVWTWTTRSKKTAWLRIGISALLALEIFVLLLLLALTYSRGAWIAFAAGSLAMFSSPGPIRKPLIVALACFGLMLLFLPSGLKRVGSYAEIEGDLSIANRLKLWTGALQMMADNPLSGVGADEFGNIFERDYQTFGHTAQNSTAVSDYLTFGAEHGLLPLGVAVGVLLFVAGQAYRGGRHNNSILQLSLTSALISLMVASAFSTLWFVREYQRLFAFIIVALVAYWLRDLYKERNWRRQFLVNLKRLGTCMGGAGIVLTALAMASLWLLPTRSFGLKAEISESDPLEVRIFEPRWKVAKGVIVYFSDIHEDSALLDHSTLRPLSALGWDVVTASKEIDGAKANALLTTLHKVFPNLKTYVSGDGTGGKLAWLVASQSEIIQAGAGFDFLSEDLDPDRGTKILQHPFLVFQSLYDDQVSANPAIRAARGLGFADLPLTIILSPNTLGYFSEGRSQWVKSLDRYFVGR